VLLFFDHKAVQNFLRLALRLELAFDAFGGFGSKAHLDFGLTCFYLI